MRIAFATLNLEGTIPVDKDVLNKVARGADMTLLRILKYIHRCTVWVSGLLRF